MINNILVERRLIHLLNTDTPTVDAVRLSGIHDLLGKQQGESDGQRRVPQRKYAPPPEDLTCETKLAARQAQEQNDQR